MYTNIPGYAMHLCKKKKEKKKAVLEKNFSQRSINVHFQYRNQVLFNFEWLKKGFFLED